MGVSESMPQDTKTVANGSKLVAKQEPRKFPFTADRIKKLPCPDSGRSYFYDSKVRGLALAITPKNKRSYILYRKVATRPMRFMIGDVADFSVEQARAEADKLNAGIARGENPQVEKRRIREENTLAELFTKYIEEYATPFCKAKTVRNYRSIYARHLGALAYRKISDIKPADVARLHSRIGRTHRFAANRTIELISSMYGKARELWGFSGSNPASEIKAFREEPRVRYMDETELRLFLRALAAEENTTIRDFILLLLLTGCRRGALQAMKFAEVNFARATWTIPPERSKNGRAVEVALTERAMQILEARRETVKKGEFVFPGAGKTKHLVEPKSAWKRLTQRMGEIEQADWLKAHKGKTAADFSAQCTSNFSSLRLHDVRHTFASWQVAGGTSLPIVGRSLGHMMGSKATQVYSHLSLDPVRQSIERAQQAMFAVAEPALLGTGDGR